MRFTAFITYFLLGSVSMNCFLSKVKKLEKTEREFQRLEHNIERLQVKAKTVSLIILKCVNKPQNCTVLIGNHLSVALTLKAQVREMDIVEQDRNQLVDKMKIIENQRDDMLRKGKMVESERNNFLRSNKLMEMQKDDLEGRCNMLQKTNATLNARVIFSHFSAFPCHFRKTTTR